MDDLIDPYVDALCQEIQIVSDGRMLPAHTVYLGGGTPSLLSANHVAQILSTIRTHFQLSPDAEITLEANPGTVDLPTLKALHSAGINRLSLGMQSAHLSELTLFGRWHTFATVTQAVNDARVAGFDNLSLDLIYGVPNQTRQMWRETLQAALDLHPDHFSIYALILESGTEITRRIKYQELPTPDDDLAADMYDDTTALLGAAGYRQYEISSWGRPSGHNTQYWRNLPYFGVGAGAHGYIDRFRTVNAMRPEVYIQRMQNPPVTYTFPATPATIKQEPIDAATDMAETLFMGLRLLNEGVSFSAFQARYGVDLRVRFGDEIDKLMGQGLLVIVGDSLRLTQQARLISNYVFRHFLEIA